MAPSRFVKAVIFWLLSLGLLGYGLLVIIAATRSDRLIYQPPRPSTYDRLPGLVRLAARDGTPLAAVWLPNPKAKHTLLVFHGNGCDLGQEEPFLRELHARGYAVMGWDYRGYGLSGGLPSEQHLYEDTRVVLSHLQTVGNVPLKNIVAYGRSLGGGAAVHLAAREPIGGLILESSFTSAFRVMTRWTVLPFDKFPSLARMRDVTCPVLVMHGTRDPVIPFWHGQALYEAAREPKTFLEVPGGGHYSLPDDAGERFWGTLTEFTGKLK